MYIVSIAPFLRPLLLLWLFVCLFIFPGKTSHILCDWLYVVCLGPCTGTFAEFGILNKNWIRFHFDVLSLILLAMEKFTPCTEVGFKAISYMRMHRIFLDWNNRRFCMYILITGCFSVLVLITHLDSLGVLWLTLPFKSVTWLFSIQTAHLTFKPTQSWTLIWASLSASCATPHWSP